MHGITSNSLANSAVLEVQSLMGTYPSRMAFAVRASSVFCNCSDPAGRPRDSARARATCSTDLRVIEGGHHKWVKMR
jgi:hypothetical protein